MFPSVEKWTVVNQKCFSGEKRFIRDNRCESYIVSVGELKVSWVLKQKYKLLQVLLLHLVLWQNWVMEMMLMNLS